MSQIKKEEIKSKIENKTSEKKNEIIKPIKKEEKKVEAKFVKRDEHKIITNQKLESQSKYNKRGGFNIAQKTEKVSQTSTSKNDRGKRNHLTYEVINVHVEKKE